MIDALAVVAVCLGVIGGVASGFSVSLVESIPVQVPLATPLTTFDAWREMITSAKSTLLVGQFYWTLSDGAALPAVFEGWRGNEILNLLREASGRGVSIRIVENVPNSNNPDNDTAAMAREGVAQVVAMDFSKFGVQMLKTGIFHTKMMIADYRDMYVGSANADWRSLTMVKEAGVVFRDAPELARDAAKIFEQCWIAGSKNSLPTAWPAELDTSYNRHSPFKTPYGDQVYLAVSPKEFCTPGRTDAVESTVDVLNGATKSIDLEVMDYFPSTSYFKPNIYWGVIDDVIRSAAFRGVQVRLLIAKWNHTSPKMQQYIKSLSDLGNVQAKWFVVPEVSGYAPVPYSRVNHAKFLVADDVAYISTSNWSADYFLSTHGVTAVIKSTPIAQTLEAIFNRDWASPFAVPL